VFFKYAEGNAFFLEKTWIHEKLQLCYDVTTQFSANDIPWLCSLFSVLAIGTQMAHMEDDRSNPNPGELEEAAVCVEDSVGLVSYHAASRLVPDVILAASLRKCAVFSSPRNMGSTNFSRRTFVYLLGPCDEDGNSEWHASQIFGR
jgi:hypothetical protein